MNQIAYFSLHMHETPLFLLPIKNLTSPSCSPTSISYMMQEFCRFDHKYERNSIFFIVSSFWRKASISGRKCGPKIAARANWWHDHASLLCGTVFSDRLGCGPHTTCITEQWSEAGSPHMSTRHLCFSELSWSAPKVRAICFIARTKGR